MSKIRMRPKLHLLVPLFGGTYVKKVVGIDPSNLIGYWPMAETAGGTANDESAQGNDGAYTGVTLANAAGPDGKLCPWWDGANDNNNVQSAGFAGDFDGGEGTFMCWGKVHNAGVWTDGALRYIFRTQKDVNNTVYINKNTANNRIQFVYKAGGTLEQQNSEAHSETTWFHVAITWSATADKVIYYFNGSQDGLVDATLGAFVGPVVSSVVGNQATGSANTWHGWLAHGAIWKAACAA